MRREHSLSENLLQRPRTSGLSIDRQSKQIPWVFKERKRGQVEREGMGREKRSKSGGEKKKKEWPYTCLLPPADTQMLQDFSLASRGVLELGPTRTKIQVLCQEEVISLQSSAQAENLLPDSYVQDWGTGKSRIG